MNSKCYLKKKLHIPIYDARLWVVVCDDIPEERGKMQGILGKWVAPYGVTGLCSNNCGYFALFFDKEHIDITNISHEVFHVTHRILEWTRGAFDEDHHEQGALLCGYLMGLVYPLVIEFKE